MDPMVVRCAMTWLKTCWDFSRRKFVWVLIGDASMTRNHRLGVVAWNTVLFLMTWWLFGFHTFELLQVQLGVWVGKTVFFLGGGEEFWERIMWKTARFVENSYD